MSRREDISTDIWGDQDFGALSPDAKLTYIWAFTNSRCGMAGIYKLRLGAAAFELGLSQDREAECWTELAAADFAYFVDGVVWVRTRVKHLRTTGENMAKSIAKDVAGIGVDHELRNRFLETYLDWGWLADHKEPFDPFQPPSNPLPPPLEQAASEPPSEGSRARARAAAAARASAREEVTKTSSSHYAFDTEDPRDRIFIEFKRETDRPRAEPTDEDWTFIARGLETNTEEELVTAVGAWKHSPFHCGENKTGKVFNTIPWLLKDDETIRELLEYADRYSPAGLVDRLNARNGQ